MSDAWIVILVVGACTVALQGARPGRDRRATSSRRDSQAVVALLAPTLLAALVVVSTFASGRSLVLDARAAGMAAAVVAVVLRAPCSSWSSPSPQPLRRSVRAF